MSETTIDLLARVGDTDVRFGDLILIGHAVMNMTAATDLMRHASPVGTTDYAEPGDAAQAFVHDFIRWCGRSADCVEASRVREYVRESGWLAALSTDTEAAA